MPVAHYLPGNQLPNPDLNAIAMLKLRSTSLLITLILLSFQFAKAAKFYVNVNNPTPGNGLSWSTAFNDLQSAIATANNYDSIFVAKGTYYPTNTADRTIAFTPKTGQTIVGGFNGTETSTYQRDYINNITILSGDIGLTGDASDNSYNVVRFINTQGSATLDGLTIQDGRADQNDAASNVPISPYNVGGGIYCFSQGPGGYNSNWIKHCIIQNNYAVYGGGIGALAQGNGTTAFNTLLFEESTFKNNKASEVGGAISIISQNKGYGTLNINNCSFIRNTADSATVLYQQVDGINDNTTSMYPALANCVMYDNGPRLFANILSNGGLGNIAVYSSIVWTASGGYTNELPRPGINYTGCLLQFPDAEVPYGCLNADPQFTDAANGNFHVAPCSPAIDGSGMTLNYSGNNKDYDGNPRPMTPGDTVDIGLYESSKIITPDPTVTTPQNFCQGSAPALTAPGGGGLRWYTDPKTGTGTTTPVINTNQAPGISGYYIYVTQTTGTMCESKRVAINIGINALPNQPIVANPVISYCQNSTALPLTATGNNLQWYASDGTLLPGVPTPSTAVLNSSTTYYVSATDAGTGCESNRTSLEVDVNNTRAQPPSVAQSVISYCLNTTTTPLTATGDNLKWYTAQNGGVLLSGAPSPATNKPVETTYYVSQTPAGFCESDRTPVTAKVNLLPDPPEIYRSLIKYCLNTTATQLTAVGTNLQWYASDGTLLPVAPTPVTTATNSFKWYVSQTDANGCESERTEQDVTIDGTQPDAPVATSPDPYCLNDPSKRLDATGENLRWYNTETGGTGMIDAPTPSTATAGETDYYVSQQPADRCESPRTLVAVTVNPLPDPPKVSEAIIKYCLRAPASQLSATGTDLQWYMTATGGTATTTAPIPNTATASNLFYYISQIDGNGCESKRTALNVITGADQPDAPGAISQSYCQGDQPHVLSADGEGLLWYSTDAGGTGYSQAPLPSTANPGLTKYYVSQTPMGGCESDRTEVSVKVVATPSPDFTFSSACAGAPVTITMAHTSEDADIIYTWNFYGAVSAEGPDNGPREVTWTNPGNYTILLTAYEGACAGSLQRDITVSPTPALIVTPVTGTYCPGNTIVMTASGADAYDWSPATGLSATTGGRVTTTFSKDITYTVKGTSANCTVSVDIPLLRNPDCQIYYYLPNAFSPNGDGLNDVFHVKTSDLPKSFTMQIYNRSGEKVFESNDPAIGWNGTLKNRNAATGTYIVIINAINSSGQPIEQRGTIELIR